MNTPFLIEGPAVISFSGGRTSAYMLRRILDVGLQSDVHVMFANTGKEREETLDFVHEIEQRWAIPIIWLEYRRQYLPKYKNVARADAAACARKVDGRVYPPQPKGIREPGFVQVDYLTASRQGEPFNNLIDMVALPNMLTRLCTQEMKIRVIKKAMLVRQYKYWDNIVGIRADEPKRVARMRVPTGQRWENVLPLADGGITKADVLAYWATSPFDLQLPLDANGETFGGNCDLCFLKSTAKRHALATAFPERVIWWAHQEARTGMQFRNQKAAYSHLLALPPEICSTEDDLGDCVCHD